MAAKELIKNLIATEEAPISLLNAIRRIGGIDNMLESDAERLVKRFKVEPKKSDPEEVAYKEYRELQRKYDFYLSLKGEVGEAHNFGEMCSYDTANDVENVKTYNSKLADTSKRMEQLKPLASRHAKFLNLSL